MYAFMMQDWTTLRLAFGTANIIQSEANWVSLQPYQDISFWLEVREASLATGITSLQFSYETAPFKDDSLFKAMVQSATISAATTTPDVQRVILASNPTIPLARWVRWKLVANGTGTAGVSDITFRIAACANAVSSLAG